jgi:hypothetical protein
MFDECIVDCQEIRSSDPFDLRAFIFLGTIISLVVQRAILIFMRRLVGEVVLMQYCAKNKQEIKNIT